MECQFCEKIISTKGNLNYHQKTSKTCLKIQQKKSERDIEIDLTNCDYCNKSFSTQNFRKHSCKNKIIFRTIIIEYTNLLSIDVIYFPPVITMFHDFIGFSVLLYED